MTKRFKTNDFIVRAKERHGDRYDYSKADYVSARTKVVVTCRVHGDFLTAPMNHLHGCGGCPKCSNRPRAFDPETWREAATEKYKGAYTYPPCVIHNTKTKVPIVCKTHGIFYQTIYNHLVIGYQCPKCARRLAVEKTKITRQFGLDTAQLTIGDTRLADKVKFLRNRLAVKGEVWQINGYGEPWI